MKITELLANYSSEDLSYFPGDNVLRYEIFSPLLQNLFENKVVYHERFTCIIKIEDLRISPEGFNAKANPYLQIEKKRPDRYFPSKPWSFSAVWSWIVLNGTCLSAPYANWSIWCDPETVKKTEQLVLEKKYEEALNNTLYELD